MLKMTGMDEVLKNLDTLREKAKSINGEVPIADLLTDDFMRRHTDFQTSKEMIDASGIQSSEEVGSEQWRSFVAAHTALGGWDELVQAAHVEWAKREMGF